ncbi:hypothetical protein [Larkinella harenae]
METPKEAIIRTIRQIQSGKDIDASRNAIDHYLASCPSATEREQIRREIRQKAQQMRQTCQQIRQRLNRCFNQPTPGYPTSALHHNPSFL